MSNISIDNNNINIDNNNMNDKQLDPNIKFGLYKFVSKCDNTDNADEQCYFIKPMFGVKATPMGLNQEIFGESQLLNYINNNRIVVADCYFDDFDDFCYEPFDIDEVSNKDIIDEPVYIDADIIKSLDMKVNLKFRTISKDKIKNVMARGEIAGAIPTVEDLYFIKTPDTLWLVSPRTLKLVNKSLDTNEVGVFKYTWFKSIDLSGIDTSEIDDMTDMFYYSYAQEIKLGKNFNSKNIKNMHHAFYSTSVENMLFRDMDLDSIVGIETAFENSSINSLRLCGCEANQDTIDKLKNTQLNDKHTLSVEVSVV